MKARRLIPPSRFRLRLGQFFEASRRFDRGDDGSQARRLVEAEQQVLQMRHRCRRQRAGGAIGEFVGERLLRQRVVRTAAERGADAVRNHRPVVEGDPHLGAERLGGVVVLGVGRGVDALHQRAGRRVMEGRALEILEHDAAGQGGARQAILHAELGVEAALRVGPVGVREAARMRP